MAKSRLFIFSIGGTGSRVLRSLTMLLAAGYKHEAGNIVPMIIDLDVTNGDTALAIKTMESYRAVQKKNQFDKLFKTEFEPIEIEDSERYSFGFHESINETFFNYIEGNDLTEETQDFLRSLFSNEPPDAPTTELNLKLKKGFKGNPNIGSIIFNELAYSNDFEVFKKTIQEGDKILIISSIFGGTGAAGFPQLLKILRDSANNPIKNASIGAIIVLPYFSLQPGATIQSDVFLSKSKAAIGYYNEHINKHLNAAYYLYDTAQKPLEYWDGGEKQKNPAHIIELIAASAVLHFANTDHKKDSKYSTKCKFYAYGIAKDEDILNLTHFFDTELQKSLVIFHLVRYIFGEHIPHHLDQDFAKLLGLNAQMNLTEFSEYNEFKKKYDEWFAQLGSDFNSRKFIPIDRQEVNPQQGMSLSYIAGLSDKYKRNWLWGSKVVTYATYFNDELNKRVKEQTNAAQLLRFIESIAAQFYNTKIKKIRTAGSDKKNKNYVFIIGKEGVSLEGWKDIGTAIDHKSIEHSKNQLEHDLRIATSIPSPFARIFLYKDALEEVVDSNIYKLDKNQIRDGAVLSYQLVSEFLDLLEFIYDNANDPDLRLREWNYENEMQNLKQSKNPKHKLLYDGIKLATENDNRLKNMSTYTMIIYDIPLSDGKKESVLLGITSPYTLVCPAAGDWKTKLTENNKTLRGIKGQPLFDTRNVVALQERSKNFIQDYLVLANSFEDKNEIWDKLKKYIEESGENARLKEQEGITPNIAVINNKLLYAGKIPILSRKPAKIIDSDFYITGSKSSDKKVLVLKQGHSDPNKLLYFRAEDDVPQYWQEEIKVAYSADLPLEQRTLPGYNLRYPYLTENDFLSDTIIELPIAINPEYFYTGLEGTTESNYLLPIKKEYFNYFSIEELKNNFTLERKSENSVVITLKIPKKKGYPIEFRKKYTKTDQEDKKQSVKNSHPIVFTKTDEEDKKQSVHSKIQSVDFMGIFFPFYRVTDVDALNDYLILWPTSDKKTAIERNFYLSDDITKPIYSIRDYSAAAEFSDRVRAGFDIIEITVNGISNLIIPQFKSIQMNTGIQKPFYAAIDFGTTNTHIAIAKSKDESPEKLEITVDDIQVISMANHEKDNNITKRLKYNTGTGSLFFKYFDNAIKHFVPFEVGKTAFSEFPVRTAAVINLNNLEIDVSDLSKNLFTRLFVNFDLLNAIIDKAIKNNFELITDLKWAIEDTNKPDPLKRTTIYLAELLWLVKNKIILNGGQIKNSQLAWMTPESTGKNTISLLRKCWEEALTLVFTSETEAIQLKELSESIAPYFDQIDKQNKMRYGTIWNIDIGGGTTDVLIINDKEGSNNNYMLSFRFAGTDLWGDGLNQNQIPRKDNGFVQALIKELEKSDSKILVNGQDIYFGLKATKAIEYYKKDSNIRNSDEIMSMAFKYNSSFEVAVRLRSYGKLKSILIIHYAAILYYISKCFLKESDNMKVPEYITFSGMGSKYLNLIGDDSVIKQLTIILLEKYGLPANKINKLQVYAGGATKESTANGAVRILAQDLANEPIKNINSYCKQFITNEPEDGLEYENVLPEGKELNEIKQDFDKFIDILYSKDIIRYCNDLEIDLKFSLPDGLTPDQYLKNEALKSAQAVLKSRKETAKTHQPIEEPIFFWMLKDTLYQLSVEIFNLFYKDDTSNK